MKRRGGTTHRRGGTPLLAALSSNPASASSASATGRNIGSLHGQELRDWDRDPEFAEHVHRYIGLWFVQDERQTWRLGELELDVASQVDKRGYFILQIHEGWPLMPARKELCLAEMYAMHTVGRACSRVGHAAQARWKRRAMIEAGILAEPIVTLAELPNAATADATLVQHLAYQLLLARRVVNGYGEPVEPVGTPIPLSAPFLTGWGGAGTDENAIRRGKMWLEKQRFIWQVDSIPGVGARKPTTLWRISGDGPPQPSA